MSIAGCYILQSCTIQHEPEMKIVFQYKRNIKLRKLPLRKRVNQTLLLYEYNNE